MAEIVCEIADHGINLILPGGRSPGLPGDIFEMPNCAICGSTGGP